MKGFSLIEFEKKLNLIVIFKEKRPQTFIQAFQLALENGVTVQKTIVEAIEVYAADRGFKCQS